MKIVETTKAVGQVLCHDLTQIIRGEKKGPAFRKGHIVTEADIPVLLSMGKDHLYVWENNENMIHENEAAQILFDLCAEEGMDHSEIKEGKIEVLADRDGLLKVDREKLYKINHLGDMMVAVRHGDLPVKKGEKLAGTRIIPLVIEKEKMEQAKAAVSGGSILKILPFHPKKTAIVTTGNEVFYGRIQDTFGPVVREKAAEYSCEVIGQTYCDDQKEHITEAICKFVEDGAELILCTGGMSVDPDDCTPGAIRNTGAHIVTYGAPVLPGAMLLLAYLKNREGKNVTIVGLPGCVMYARRTIFDLVLPRIIADDPIKKEELDALGEGGLCLNCEICHFPNCGFGKGRM
ncbi:MAG: molybdopterin-binding protein [Eubacteriales bacterium]|nr:molybdopterin-binding protein [Eubacteriales bacterium]